MYSSASRVNAILKWLDEKKIRIVGVPRITYQEYEYSIIVQIPMPPRQIDNISMAIGEPILPLRIPYWPPDFPPQSLVIEADIELSKDQIVNYVKLSNAQQIRFIRIVLSALGRYNIRCFRQPEEGTLEVLRFMKFLPFSELNAQKLYDSLIQLSYLFRDEVNNTNSYLGFPSVGGVL